MLHNNDIIIANTTVNTSGRRTAMLKKAISIITAFALLVATSFPAKADIVSETGKNKMNETEIALTGGFESTAGYYPSNATLVDRMDFGRETLGILSAAGNMVSQSFYVNAIPTLVYEEGKDVWLSYHLFDDAETIEVMDSKETSVGGVPLSRKIGRGALTVQLSYDGRSWEKPVYIARNALLSMKDLSSFYRINHADIKKGVFVRVILGYCTKMSQRRDDNKKTNHLELYVARLISDSDGFATGDLSSEENPELGIGAAVLSDLTIANRVTGEGVFHSTQGQGFAAEAANIQAEAAAGKNVEHVGYNNVKNGADYVIKDDTGTVITQIQSKYYQTASNSIEACFDKETGLFRYYTSDGPMTIEVPKDQYAGAVEAMAKKIEEGKVPNVTDPAKAKDLVKEGAVTYKQAVNIAKAGTIDSLKYDAKNSCVTAATAFGISATIQFARSIWQHDNVHDALKKSIYTGLKVGGVSFATSVLASQLSRAGLNSFVYHGTEEVLKTTVGYKAAALIANASRVGATPIYGAAATKCAAKLFTSNAIVGTITLVLFTVPDVVETFRGRISVKQLLKNTATTAGGIGGGVAGAAGGATVGSMVFPGPGTVVGGVVGGVGGAIGATFAVDKIGDMIAEDDAEEMVAVLSEEFQVIAEEYLLTQEEADKISEGLSMELTGKVLKDMYASKNRSAFARGIIEPITKDVIKERKVIIMPSEEEMADSLIDTLNEIYDAEQVKP